MPKIVVFTDDLAYPVRKALVEIDRACAGIEWLVVGPKTEAPPPPSDDDSPGAEYQLARILARPNVRLVEVIAIGGANAAAAVVAFHPDLGVAFGAQEPPQALVTCPRLGTIALHRGKLPAYRGADPVFWQLWNDEPTIGCSVQLVTAEVGAGDILAEAAVPRPRYPSLEGMRLLVDEAGVELCCSAVRAMLGGTARPRRQSGEGKLYPPPTPGQITELRRKLRAGAPALSPVRELAKTAYFALRLCLDAVVARVLRRRSRVAVLMYHRVNDDLRDAVTVGIAQFDRQMALLRRFCRIVSIEELIQGASPEASARPLVCVTFDDGYKDNFTAAAPILLKHRVPASFFVSTGFMGTEKRFPHDLEKGLSQLENMSWAELGTLRRHGFVIGSHTVNHIDCGKAAPDLLREEIHQSLATLRRELGGDEVVFAYPFGRPENMSDTALSCIKAAGYAGCLTAYGGFNRGRVDPFGVLRSGVNWSFSDVAFLCRAFALE